MLDRPRAWELASTLDLDMNEVGICLACLTFVAFPLDRGDEREVRRNTLQFTPILWDEGLERPARSALERARGWSYGFSGSRRARGWVRGGTRALGPGDLPHEAVLRERLLQPAPLEHVEHRA